MKVFKMQRNRLVFIIATSVVACGLLFLFINKMPMGPNNSSAANLLKEVEENAPFSIANTPYEGKNLSTYVVKLTDNLVIHGFDLGAMQSLHGEVFAGDVYRFTADNNTPLILDCGSNIGFSVLYFKSIYPQAIIYAFEPDLVTFKLLRANIKTNNLTDTYAFNVALDEKKGKMAFHIDKDKPGNPGMSLYMKSNTSVEVNVEPLSEYIKQIDKLHKRKIDLLKIDVEGSEHGILNDLVASKTLHLVNEMIIEYHHHMGNTDDKLGGFLKILEDHGFGYQVATYDQRSFTSRGGGQSFMLHAYRKNSN